MENVKKIGIQNSILKEILRNKECSTGKYLAPMSFKESSGSEINYFITPVSTRSGSDILIISRVIRGNWYKSILKVGAIVDDIKQHYKVPSEQYTFILHAFFEDVELEKFYVIDVMDKFSLLRLKMNELEDLLT